MAVRIITDSTVDIADKYRNLFTVVPLTVSFGEKDYIDGVTLNKQEFYQKLVSSQELPKTSQATPAAFAEVFRKLQENGDEAVVITVSSRLSGTYQSACIAAPTFRHLSERLYRRRRFQQCPRCRQHERLHRIRNSCRVRFTLCLRGDGTR